jgi:hypothetical protein
MYGSSAIQACLLKFSVDCRCVRLGVPPDKFPWYLKEIKRICKPGTGHVQIGEGLSGIYDDGESTPKDAPIWKVLHPFGVIADGSGKLSRGLPIQRHSDLPLNSSKSRSVRRGSLTSKQIWFALTLGNGEVVSLTALVIFDVRSHFESSGESS